MIFWDLNFSYILSIFEHTKGLYGAIENEDRGLNKSISTLFLNIYIYIISGVYETN